MNWTRLTAVALAALLVVSGVAAAAPGNAPAGGDRDGAENGESGPPGEIGPPGGLPEPVPEFVGALLDRIAQGVDGLGQAVADVVPGSSGPSESRPPN